MAILFLIAILGQTLDTCSYDEFELDRCNVESKTSTLVGIYSASTGQLSTSGGSMESK